MQPQQDEMNIPQLADDWISTATLLPKEGQPVMTKIDDRDGCRNVAPLKLMSGHWFFEDGSMYVYYRPTHWKPK